MHKETIAVIGVGRLGLCLALNLEKAGYNVIGVDVVEEYVNNLNTKTFHSPEPGVNHLLTASKHFSASTQLSSVIHTNIKLMFVVLPTPSLPNGQFSHDYIDDVATQLISFGKRPEPCYLIINSTTMPGYCNKLQERIARLNYEVVYNPEFIAQGSILHDQLNPDQVLIGENSKQAGDLLEAVYLRMCENKPVFCRMLPISAEITKLATNCFLTTKIAFANAIGDIATQSGAEPEKVLAAIGVDSRIGTKYFKYGFGYGGPCFPRDNKAFESFAAGSSYQMLISSATDKANQLHADFLLTHYLKKYQPHETICFDSVTYKKGTDILEESQQLKLASELAKAGRVVLIKESVSVIEALQKTYGNLFNYQQHEH